MGWAGPAQPTGPDSAPKCAGPILAQQKSGISLLGQTRPGRQSWDGEGRHCCYSAAAGAEWKRNRAMENERVRGSCSVKERGK
jgi:hypothetical protein